MGDKDGKDLPFRGLDLQITWKNEGRLIVLNVQGLLTGSIWMEHLEVNPCTMKVPCAKRGPMIEN